MLKLSDAQTFKCSNFQMLTLSNAELLELWTHLIRVGHLVLPAIAGPGYEVLAVLVAQQLEDELPELDRPSGGDRRRGLGRVRRVRRWLVRRGGREVRCWGWRWRRSQWWSLEG